jgi:hypothetical protein
VAYLTYDLLLGYYNQILDAKMTAHHLFGIVGGLSILSESEAASAGISNFHLVALMTTEITSPMWQLKNLFKYLGKDSTKAAKINEAVFGLTFITIRPFFCWILWYNMMVARFNWVIIFNSMAVYVLGVVWSYTIVCILRIKVLKIPPGRFEKIRDSPFLAGIILTILTAVLPFAVGQQRDWKFIHLRIAGFAVI